MTTQYTDVFCDFLSVTYSPDDSPYQDVLTHFESLGYLVETMDEKVTLLLGDSGALVRFETAPKFHKLSLSGTPLRSLRSTGHLDSTLALLGTRPHRVTRLDAALDAFKDAIPVFRYLDRKFPDGYANLTRKKVKIEKVMSVRDSDGQYTGTYYIGSRGGAAKAFARVYDKQHEALQKRDQKLPPTTRYEVVVKEGATLRDASRPDALFWHFAAPALLRRPAGISPWEKSEDTGWSYEQPQALPVDVIKRMVEHSGQLKRMEQLADSLGPEGRTFLTSLLTRHLASKVSLP